MKVRLYHFLAEKPSMVSHLPQGKNQSPCSDLNPSPSHQSHQTATLASLLLFLEFIKFTPLNQDTSSRFLEFSYPIYLHYFLLHFLLITLSMKSYSILHDKTTNSPPQHSLSSYPVWCLCIVFITFWHTIFYLLIFTFEYIPHQYH